MKMFYKDYTHFFNSLKKMVRASHIKFDLFALKDCADVCYDKDLTGDCKSSVCSSFFFEIRNIIDELQEQDATSQRVDRDALLNALDYALITAETRHARDDINYSIDTAKSKQNLSDLFDKCGVYFIYNDERELIYIGKSSNLQERIVSSLSERRGTYYRYVLTNTAIDASIYEAYYISKHKPIKNVQYKFDGECTIKLDELEKSEEYMIVLLEKTFGEKYE